MSSADLSIRFALRFFPRGFRERQGQDLLETYEDLLAHTAATERPRTRRRAVLQLVRSGLAERFAAFKPLKPIGHSSRHTRSSAMDDFFQDLKSAYRSVLRRPGFALMVMLTLAIGLGSSAAMFGVVHGVLLEPLPFKDSDRLVSLLRVFTNDPDREAGNMSLPDLHDVRQEVRGLEAAAGYSNGSETLIVDGEPQILVSATITDGLLSIFGLAPHLGRDLTAEDAIVDAPLAVVLGHEFWRSHFGSDGQILGQPLMLSGAAYEIVGVAPQGFDFPEKAQLWTAEQIDTVDDCGRGCHIFQTIARLGEGVEIQAVDQELDVLGAALEAQYPKSNTYKRFIARRIKEQEVAPVRGALWMLLGAVQLVVLIAAANAANLILVHGSGRRREMAIRTAVGAGRGRLFRQLMLENTVLAAGSALLGWGVGLAMLRAFVALAPPDLPRVGSIALDGPVLLFTAALTLVVLMLFGFAPAWRAASSDLRGRSQVGENLGKRSRYALLTAEVALALLLLLGSGLLLRSFAEMTEVDLGFETERITRIKLLLPDAAYPEPEQVASFSEQLEERLRATPGVEAAGLVFAGPFGSAHITSHIYPLDRPDPEPGESLAASFDVVTPGFFETLGLAPVRGRLFADTDTQQAPLVLVISETLAERYFPGKDPIGERARVGVSFGFEHEDDAAYTIVGVVPDIRAYSITAQPDPAVYMAQAQTGVDFISVILKSRVGADVVPAVREHIHALDPALPIRSIETQDAAFDEALGPPRFYLSLLSGFAAIALLLSAVGLYAVIAYLVSQRTRELAVRMALGADSGSVLRLVLADALRPAVLGIALGLIGAFAGARVLDSLLYGITPHDVLTYTAAPLVLLLVAMLAALAPALRAARLEPRVALEQE